MSGNMLEKQLYPERIAGLNWIEIDLSAYEKGMYLLHIKHDNGTEVRRIQRD